MSAADSDGGPCTAHKVYIELKRLLIADNVVAGIPAAFAQLTNDRARVEFAHELLQQRGLLRHSYAGTRFAKSDAECAQLRQQAEEERDNGNKLELALQLFTRAVAKALPRSENLEKACLGRSQILRKLDAFANCAEDLQLAAECVGADQTQIKRLLAEVESAGLAQSHQVDEEAIPAITHDANTAIACAGDSVVIKRAVDGGRFVEATKDIQIGEVIAVEKPFAAVLLPNVDIATTHCHHCTRFIYGPMPCDHCAFAMYCTAACKATAWELHHRFECPIASEIHELELSNLTLFALRVAILAAPQYDMIQIDSMEYEAPEERYESNRYKEIHNLCTNTALRCPSDLFNRAVSAALIYELVKRKTTFFTAANACDAGRNAAVFQGLLMRHLQTVPSNFHEINDKHVREDKSSSECVEIAGGAYSFLSMINHSCAPNVLRSGYGTTVVLRALTTIRAGEQLFDNYGYHFALMSRADRRRHLQTQYLFDCKCRACVGNWPTYANLKVIDGELEISYNYIRALQLADRQGVFQILQTFIDMARTLERLPQPCKNLADVQECIKECYCRLSNKNFV